jgi:hypothetical protein
MEPMSGMTTWLDYETARYYLELGDREVKKGGTNEQKRVCQSLS